MKVAVIDIVNWHTVIDTLTQEEFHGAFQKCIATGEAYLEGD